MSNLVKYEGRVSESSSEDLYETVRSLYRIVYGITGYKVDTQKIKTIDIPLTVQYIEENHPRRTADDLEKAFKWGALGKFGEFTGINTKTIAGWLEAYIKTPEFKESIRPPKRKELPPPPMDYQEVFNQALKDHREQKQMRGLASLIFNACHKLGKFNWKDEEFIEECKYRARCKMLDRIRELEDRKLKFELKHKLKDEQSEAFKAECRRQATLIILENENTP